MTLATSQAAEHVHNGIINFQICLWFMLFVQRAELVQIVSINAKLRCAGHGHHIVPSTKTKTFDSCSFHSTAPTFCTVNFVTFVTLSLDEET